MKYQRIGHYLVLNIDDKFHNKSIIELLHYYKQSKKSIHQLRMSLDVYLNNLNIKQNFEKILTKGDMLKLPIFTSEEIDFTSQDIPLEIIYEDDFMLIINKQANIEVHPDTKTGINTLVNGVSHYYKETKQNSRVRYINRLDRDTTGIIIFVKNYFVHTLYDYLIRNNKIKRYYLALVSNKLPQNQGVIEKKIGKNRHSNQKMIVSKTGVYAKTAYKIIKQYRNYSLIELELYTGRTHQIRVHMNAINCPILGDKLYGNLSPLIDRQALHAYKVVIPHPITLEPLTFIAEVPNDMKKLI